MKVLFLDIDGVLNSHRTFAAWGTGHRSGVVGSAEALDPIAVGLVRNIVRAAGAVIVLSSSWRILYRFDRLAAVLDLPIVAETTHSLAAAGNRIRGAEIQQWLDENPGVESYAIVDDDSDMLPHQLARFVKTDFKNGLDWDRAEQLASLLGVDIHDAARTGRADRARVA